MNSYFSFPLSKSEIETLILLDTFGEVAVYRLSTLERYFFYKYLNILKDKGLVEYEKDKRDNRVKKWKLTKKGKIIANYLRKIYITLAENSIL